MQSGPHFTPFYGYFTCAPGPRLRELYERVGPSVIQEKENAMSTQKTTPATITLQTVPLPGARRRNALFIWLDAWKEHSKLQKLDDHALADMGLSKAGRASVSVSDIAARMREGA